MANGPKLPEFSLPSSAGERKFPSGRNALLCFVKEDCPTCQITMPLIEAAHGAFASKLRCEASNLDVLAIGQDAEGNAKLVEQYRMKTPMLDDSALKVSFAYGLDTVPTIILAAPDGSEMRRFVGFDKTDWQDMMAELARLSGTRGASHRLVEISAAAPRMRLQIGRAGNRRAAGGRGAWRKAHRASNRNRRGGPLRIHVRTRPHRWPAGDSSYAGARQAHAHRHAARSSRGDRVAAAEHGSRYHRENCRQCRHGGMQAGIHAGGSRGNRGGRDSGIQRARHHVDDVGRDAGDRRQRSHPRTHRHEHGHDGARIRQSRQRDYRPRGETHAAKRRRRQARRYRALDAGIDREIHHLLRRMGGAQPVGAAARRARIQESGQRRHGVRAGSELAPNRRPDLAHRTRAVRKPRAWDSKRAGIRSNTAPARSC